MTSNSKYFDGDCVYRVTRKGRVQFGLVVENAEYLSSDDEDDAALNEVQPSRHSRMKRGRIRVAWHPSGEAEIVSEKAVKLHDRFLMPGEIVRKVACGKGAQLGFCRSTKISATLQVLGTDYVINNVDSAELQSLEKFRKDSALCVGSSWSGLIQTIKRELGLRFPDGSMCILQESNAACLEDVVHRRLRTSELPSGRFYEGQQLHGPMRLFKSARWLHCTKETMDYPPEKHVQVTVEKVKPVEAYAKSLYPHYGDSNVVIHFHELSPGQPPAQQPAGGAQQPQQEQQPRAPGGQELVNLYLTNDVPDKGWVQAADVYEVWGVPLGSRRRYKLQAADIINLEVWRQACAQVYVPTAPSGTAPRGHGDSGDCKDDQPVGPSDVAPVPDTAAEGGAVPGQSRLKCGCHPPKQRSLKPGDVVVTETLATTTLVEVVWQDGTVESGILSTELYPILHMDENEYFPGDFVVEDTDNPRADEYGVVRRMDHCARTAEVAQYRMYKAGAAEPHPEELRVEEVSVYNIREHPDFNYKPTYFVFRNPQPHVESAVPVGQILDIMPAGQITVRWLDGTKSQCYPQELIPCLRSHYHPEDDIMDDDDDDEEYMELDDGSLTVIDPAGGRTLGVVASRAQQLFDRMQVQVEVLRDSLARLEESIRLHPVMQSNAAIRRLGELYRQSNQLVQFVGASCLQWGWANLPRDLLVQVRRLFSTAAPPQLAPALQQGIDNGASGDQGAAAALPAGQERPPTSSPQRLMAMSVRQLFNHIVTQSRHFQSQLSGTLARAYGGAQFRFGVAPPQRSVGTSTEDLPLEDAAVGGAGVTVEVEKFGTVTLPRDDVPGAWTAGLPVLPPEFELAVDPRIGSPWAEPVPVPPENADGEGSKKKLKSFMEEVGKRLAELMEAHKKDEEAEEESQESPLGAGDNGADDITVFSLMKTAPESHSYRHVVIQPNDLRVFTSAVRKEMDLLARNLPDSIVVKSFEDRSDLYSALIRGPGGTPYEDGLFLFDLRLPADYPHSPPICHYHSFCRERLNPNLYVDGKVCVSLLGTWDGKGPEVWSPKRSSLLQVLVSIQGLILVAEPYYNEAGFEQQRSCLQASENSRIYNEGVVLKVVQSMEAMLLTPQDVFQEEIEQHFLKNAARFVARLESWLRLSEAWHGRSSGPTSVNAGTFKEFAQQGGYGALPDFPLLPVSRGFCLAMRKELATFKDMLKDRGIFCLTDGAQSG